MNFEIKRLEFFNAYAHSGHQLQLQQLQHLLANESSTHVHGHPRSERRGIIIQSMMAFPSYMFLVDLKGALLDVNEHAATQLG